MKKAHCQLYFENNMVMFATELKKWDLEDGGQYVDIYKDGCYIGHLHNFKFKKYCDFKKSDDSDEIIKAYQVIFK